MPPNSRPLPERWYRAARYPTRGAAERPYLRLQEFITGGESPPDVAGYRFVAEDGTYVAVLADNPPPLDLAAINRIDGILGSGHPAMLDEGLLDLLFEDWAPKRGPGPPSITRGRNEFASYEPRGPGAPA